MGVVFYESEHQYE